MPQKTPSYLEGVKQYFSKKNERDRFYDVFKVKQPDRSKWVGALNKELHTLKQSTSLLQDLDQKIKTSSDLTLSSVLEIIKEYKEGVQEYTSSQEKVKKMIAAADVKDPESLFSPPQSTFLGAESLDQLDVYEKLFSTLNILLEGANKIKIPSLVEVDDPCDYFSTVTGVVDILAKVSASYHSPNNPFVRALSSEEKEKILSSLNNSMSFVKESVARDIQDAFDQKSGSKHPMDQKVTRDQTRSNYSYPPQGSPVFAYS